MAATKSRLLRTADRLHLLQPDTNALLFQGAPGQASLAAPLGMCSEPDLDKSVAWIAHGDHGLCGWPGAYSASMWPFSSALVNQTGLVFMATNMRV